MTGPTAPERPSRLTAPAPLLATRGLTKRFPGVLAVDGVDLAVPGGEIVALLGQNGAGKSTLIQILAGVHPHGTLRGRDRARRRTVRTRRASRRRRRPGSYFIPQEVNVVPERTVAENMLLNDEPTRFGLIDRPALLRGRGAELRHFGVDVDPRARMGSLDLATQQLVVIARALSKRARVLILDEPTAALTETEAQRLFARMRALRERGVACIFVSHRLAEVFAVADRILVMRDGRLRGDHRVEATTREAIVAEMIGGDADAADARSGREPVASRTALEVEGLTVYDPVEPERKRVDGLTFSLREGEILGLFGLLGAGCSTAALALFGAWPGRVEATRFEIGGERGGDRAPADAIGRGLGLLAQDRRESLIHDHSIADNILLASLPAVSPRGVLDRDRTAADRPALRRSAADPHAVGRDAGGDALRGQPAEGAGGTLAGGGVAGAAAGRPDAGGGRGGAGGDQPALADAGRGGVRAAARLLGGGGTGRRSAIGSSSCATGG